jgi:hypothetical protein
MNGCQQHGMRPSLSIDKGMIGRRLDYTPFPSTLTGAAQLSKLTPEAY